MSWDKYPICDFLCTYVSKVSVTHLSPRDVRFEPAEQGLRSDDAHAFEDVVLSGYRFPKLYHRTVTLETLYRVIWFPLMDL
jgi:hypothetical protein